MPEYRFLNLGEGGQALIARIALTLDDDAMAIARAEQLIVGEQIEVWQGSRLVASLPSIARPAPRRVCWVASVSDTTAV